MIVFSQHFLSRWMSIFAFPLLISCADNTPKVTASVGSSAIEGNQISRQGLSNCNSESWTAGITEWCNGQLIYRDYVYDDYGADLGALSFLQGLSSETNPLTSPPGLLARTAGDIRYPKGAESTADLVKFTLHRSEKGLKAVFELNALYSANQTRVALAIDEDNDSSTGSLKIMNLEVAGADRVLESNQGDPDSNTIEIEFSSPASPVFKIWAVTAQSTGEVMNVAFRGVDEEAGGRYAIPDFALPGKGSYWEDKQAAALAAGNINQFFGMVDLSRMDGGMTVGFPLGSGLHQRVYTSKYSVPDSKIEGLTQEGVPGRGFRGGSNCDQSFHFMGKYQPYAIYIPKVESKGAKSAELILHGCQANHASQINQPNMQKQFGDDLDRILISPLARGAFGFYSDLSERDVFDVLSDVIQNFEVDEDRIFIGGYSMGGYGAIRLAALYPDLFAGLNNWSGYSGHDRNTALPGNPVVQIDQEFQALNQGKLPVNNQTGALGNMYYFLNNLRHVPSTHSYVSGENQGYAMFPEILKTQEIQYELFFHLVGEHSSLLLLDEWTKEAQASKDWKRVKNPMRVTYRTNENFMFPEYGLLPNKAYWISNLKGLEPADIFLDLESKACSNDQSRYLSAQGQGTRPVPYVHFSNQLKSEGASPPEKHLKGSLLNVKEATIDVPSSCLTQGSTYEIQSDGPSRLIFSDGREINLKQGINKGSI